MSLLTLRGLFERLRAPSQSQKDIFPPKRSSRNDTKTPGKSAQPSEIFVSGHLSERGSEFEKR